MIDKPPATLTLTVPLYEQLLAGLQAAYPLEGCGLLAGQAGLVTRVYPISNAAASPTAYRMAPQEQIDAMLSLAAADLVLLAIYHSHPRGPAWPSATDVASAYYPDAAQLIVSLADRNRPEARAFVIDQERVRQIPLSIA